MGVLRMGRETERRPIGSSAATDGHKRQKRSSANPPLKRIRSEASQGIDEASVGGDVGGDAAGDADDGGDHGGGGDAAGDADDGGDHDGGDDVDGDADDDGEHDGGGVVGGVVDVDLIALQIAVQKLQVDFAEMIERSTDVAAKKLQRILAVERDEAVGAIDCARCMCR